MWSALLSLSQLADNSQAAGKAGGGWLHAELVLGGSGSPVKGKAGTGSAAAHD